MRQLLTRQLGVSLGRHQWSAPLWGVLLAFIGVLFFLRLGMWQMGRAEQKTVMSERYEQRTNMPWLDFSQVLTRGRDIEDLPVRLQGRYDNSRAVFMENQMRQGRTGFHVYTVFFPAGDPVGILVNRGWIGVGADMQRLPEVPLAQATAITGTLAFPSPFFTVGEPDYQQRPLRVARLEMDKLSNALGVELRPFVIRLDDSAADGFVREWAPAARLGVPPEKHRAYAFQWFSLAVAVIGVLFFVNLRKSNSSEHE